MIELTVGFPAADAVSVPPRVAWSAFRAGWNNVPQRQVKKVLNNPPSQLETDPDPG